jgi:hypothetical protein
MKRKFFLIVSLLFFISITVSNCKKEKPSNTLPPITQTGANTFGCKINGTVWVPYFQCAAFTGPCSEMQTNFLHPNVNSFLPLTFQLLVRRSNKVDNEGGFVIANFSVGQPSASTISQTGNVFDSLNISCDYNNHTYVYYGFSGFAQHAGNNFIITKLDTVNKIMSGTFNFKLIDYPDSIIVTDGRLLQMFQIR